MAAANKPTAVHFSLIAFVTISLVLSVFTYLGWKKNFEKETQLTARDKELGEQKAEVTRLRSEHEAMKGLLGINLDSSGTDTADALTVLGRLNAEMQAQGGAQVAPTLLATLSGLRAAIDNLSLENQSLKVALNDNKSQLTSLESGANERVGQFQTSQQSSEQQLQGNIAAHQQAIDEKNGEINQVKKQYNEATVQVGQVQDAFDQYRRQIEERTALLEKQIDFFKDQIDELTKQGFEREDGQIVSIDNTTSSVWINLGSADGLRAQVSFSVYTSDHRGIGRGVEDIKAKIEVTRILEPHLAEARILSDDLFRPIAEGDPIYSPLWAAGRKEYFATVGRMDLDEDGRSDMDLFREIVSTAGAEVELSVNDSADREPADAKLSARTKFLIIGDIDDPADFSGIPERQDLAKKMQAQRDALISEARLYGIRVVRLNDFLDFIGWKPEQRLWQPGANVPFNLRQGSQSATTDETYEDRTSDGTVSEIFRRNRTGEQQSSDGQTSELFKNK